MLSSAHRKPKGCAAGATVGQHAAALSCRASVDGSSAEPVVERDRVRIYRRDDLDDWASLPSTPRDDGLREMVDQLPPLQKFAVERLFFGGASKVQVAREAGVDPRILARALAAGLEALKATLLETHDLGAMSAGFVARFDERSVPQPRDVAAGGIAA